MVSLRSLITASLALASAAPQVFASPISLEEMALRELPDISCMLPPVQQDKCSEKLQRKAWQSLTDEEKKDYLDAELCLMWQIPAKTGLTATVSRFDDLIKAHQLQSMLVHNDGWFLPFHRLHMHAHERLLREECGYKGAQPYWDEEADAGQFTKSEIFDPELGFGGSGTGSGQCIKTGPFANYTLHTGPGYQNTEHCIKRAISDSTSQGSGKSYVDACLAHQDYASAWPCIAARPHVGGHNGVGGDMANPISSPGDPLYYMHHAFLDRVWWRWQKGDLEKRLYDISGYTSQSQPSTGWVNATLDDELNMYGIIPNATVRDVMDIGGDLLCSEYLDPESTSQKE